IAKSGNEITKVLLNISLILLKAIVKLTLSVISKLTMRAVRLITMIVGGIIGGLLGGIGLAVATEGKSEFIEDIGELLGANRLFGITGAIDNMADFTGKLFVTIGVTNTNPADEMGGFVVGFLIGAYFGIGIGPFMAKFNEELILLVKTTWGVFWDEFNTDEIVAEERKDGVVVVRRKSGGGMVLLGMLFFMVFLWIPKLCIISFFCPLIAIYRLVFDS
ncbi:MAG: hypothetical protein FWH27_18715, partial [Planctomycetaceae bacterium]|nr:hypothetical protein [Planctomycetaceae bacterium]